MLLSAALSLFTACAPAEIVYTLKDDGTYEVSGTSGYKLNLKQVDIPAEYNGVAVTSVADKAFISCAGLTTVTMQNSVTEIGFSAFAYCGSLKSVILSENVTSLPYAAFAYCGALKTVTVSPSLAEIGSMAFYNCLSLEEFAMPSGVTSVGARAFAVSGLKSVALPDSVTELGQGAFYASESLAEVTVGGGVTKLDFGVFAYCTALTHVSLPASLLEIAGTDADGNIAAFAESVAVERVTFGGTQEQWQNVTIGAGNDVLSAAQLVCNG